MNPAGIILFGPPASGKDTVTARLVAINERYEHFRRLKSGGERKAGYRAVSADELDALSARGDIVYSNRRYDARYAVDRPGIESLTRRHKVPIVHIGQVEGIHAVLEGCSEIDWLVVGLWCSREESEARLVGRTDSRIAERLAAWDATAEDLRLTHPGLFGLWINTGRVSVHAAVATIDSCRTELDQPTVAT